MMKMLMYIYLMTRDERPSEYEAWREAVNERRRERGDEPLREEKSSAWLWALITVIAVLVMSHVRG